MPLIEEEVTIHAAPETVFETVRRLEGYPHYVRGLHHVEHKGGSTYVMGLKVAGVSLSWEGVVTECDPPRRFAWKATSGMESRGCFELAEAAAGTHVHFWLEYELPGRWLNRMLGERSAPLVAREGNRILERVRADLEAGSEGA